MPTKQKRLTCARCGCKRVAKYMVSKQNYIGMPLRGCHYCKFGTMEKTHCAGVRLLQQQDTPGTKKKTK